MTYYARYNAATDSFDAVRRDFLTDIAEKQKPFTPKPLTIKKVIFNQPCTIVLWSDNTKTIVKATDEPFDPEKGVAMACMKKMLTSKEYHRRLEDAYEYLNTDVTLNGILNKATKALDKFSKTIKAYKHPFDD